MTSNHPPTVVLEQHRVAGNHRVTLYEDRVRFHTGRENTHIKVDFSRQGIGIVPVMADGRVVLGLHHRYCPFVWSWEIAAGSTELGEGGEATARRELMEETGLEAGELVPLLDYYPAPGLGNEHFIIYLAPELTGSPKPHDAEEIYELKLATWADIEAMIARRDILDGLTISGLLAARVRGLI